jgi:phytoene synthase
MTLSASYAACRQLHAHHGRSYFLATRLLPAPGRPSVHALYGLARAADEIVDDLTSELSLAQKAAALAALQDAVLAGDPDVDIAPAVADTLRRHDIPVDWVEDFFAAMAQDLTVSSYPTYDDLRGYMHGSAAVIGLQLTCVFGTVGPRELAAPYAADLGVAMQLTNFLRDIGEDLQRGRVYLPTEDLDRFGVTTQQLRAGAVDGAFRSLMRFEIARARTLYAGAAQGIRLLSPEARPCVEAAMRLYAGILAAIERADYDALTRRVRVSPPRRLALVAVALSGR